MSLLTCFKPSRYCTDKSSQSQEINRALSWELTVKTLNRISLALALGSLAGGCSKVSPSFDGRTLGGANASRDNGTSGGSSSDGTVSFSVANKDQLPDCKTFKVAPIAWVESEKQMYTCAAAKWVPIDLKGGKGDQGAKGDQGPASAFVVKAAGRAIGSFLSLAPGGLIHVMSAKGFHAGIQQATGIVGGITLFFESKDCTTTPLARGADIGSGEVFAQIVGDAIAMFSTSKSVQSQTCNLVAFTDNNGDCIPTNQTTECFEASGNDPAKTGIMGSTYSKPITIDAQSSN